MQGSQIMYAILLMISQACDPALLTLFTPPRPEIGRYEVCTSPDSLEVLRADGLSKGIQFGDAVALEPLDAFGSGGAYNRFALARLYGGRRVRVVRGWRQEGDRFESVTLLSPHPNAGLTRLESGTMIIRFTLRRSTQKARNTHEEIGALGSIRVTCGINGQDEDTKTRIRSAAG
jgi:hypothetical protein